MKTLHRFNFSSVRVALLALSLPLAIACGDSSGPGGSGGSAGAGGDAAGGAGGTPLIEPQGACPAADTQVGRFVVERQPQFGVVQGTVSEGVVPTSIPDVLSEDGTCRVLKRRTLSCIPACTGAETCGEGGQCIPFPRQISVGDVSITGLTKPTEMSPQQPGNTYFAPGADNPPFTPGSAVVLTATGADPIAGFQLVGRGSTPLTDSPTWVLEHGVALSVTWPASSDTDTQVEIDLSIDQHGLSPLSLSCVFDDTGSAEIPSALVDQLIDSGVSGFPNGRIYRRTADHVDIDPGCVELLVGSPVSANVSVKGHTPCMDSTDCTPPETCNLDLEQCE
ncbi:MAG: hypothetical protein U0271_36545 [Polyangiaceae bacterium]